MLFYEVKTMQGAVPFWTSWYKSGVQRLDKKPRRRTSSNQFQIRCRHPESLQKTRALSSCKKSTLSLYCFYYIDFPVEIYGSDWEVRKYWSGRFLVYNLRRARRNITKVLGHILIHCLLSFKTILRNWLDGASSLCAVPSLLSVLPQPNEEANEPSLVWTAANHRFGDYLSLPIDFPSRVDRGIVKKKNHG